MSYWSIEGHEQEHRTSDIEAPVSLIHVSGLRKEAKIADGNLHNTWRTCAHMTNMREQETNPSNGGMRQQRYRLSHHGTKLPAVRCVM